MVLFENILFTIKKKNPCEFVFIFGVCFHQMTIVNTGRKHRKQVIYEGQSNSSQTDVLISEDRGNNNKVKTNHEKT